MILCIVVGILAGGLIGVVVSYLVKRSSSGLALSASPWRGFPVGAALGLIFVMVYGCPWSGSSEYDKGTREEGFFIMSRTDFQELVLESDRPVLVDFFSPTCPPCRRLAPKIVSLKKKYEGKASVYKVDVTKLPELAREYEIRVVPSVSFFDDGKEVERILGNEGESVYANVLDRMIERNPSISE